VKAEVLERANGKCEFCLQNAPFTKVADGTPFLEVHYIKWLSKEGKDTVDNAIALCPNCHKGAHFGNYKIERKNGT
jgi:5-methylcytosine-specific restriction protein A